MKSILILFACFAVTAFAEQPSYVMGTEATVDRDVKIPKLVADEVEKVFEKIHFDEHNALGGEKTMIPRKNLDLKIYFKEKSAGILGGSDQVITPSSGGGVVNLADFVQPGRGTFYWQIKLETHLPEDAKFETKVYFLSQHIRKNRSDGAAIGLGCGKVADISSHFVKALSHPPGEQLNTSFDTHLGVLLGTYYFFAIDKESVQVATVTFKDSRAQSVACPGFYQSNI